MKDIENFDSIEELYKNYINEKNKIKDVIDNYEKEINDLENQLLYYKNNYNELRMFSPRKNLQLKDEFISATTKKIDLLRMSISSYKLKLEDIDSNMEAIHFVKEKINIQPGTEVLAVNENDRKRIARDLHDYTIQDLIYLIHKVEIASKFIEQDPVRAKLELSTITKSLKNTIHNLRNMVYDLHPMTFDDLGFEATLNNFIDYISNNSNMIISYENNAVFENYNDLILINLFRIIQECCNNSIKHSKGTKINIKIFEEDNKINLIIQDDGVGFDVTEKQSSKSNHFGIKIIKDRVFLLSGTCEFHSDSNGTKISINVANF